MKLHDALRKVIRHFGVNVIEEKRLMVTIHSRPVGMTSQAGISPLPD